MDEQYVMRPGDTFVAPECGCSFTVESGPSDESMAMQAPRCCCGHEMHKQDTGITMGSTRGGHGQEFHSGSSTGAPSMMPD
jgi:hypothetical protein